jgi:hypothetical protein
MGVNSGPNVHRSTRTDTTFDGAVRMKRAELGRREEEPRPRGVASRTASLVDGRLRAPRLPARLRAERETREGHARSFLTGVNLAVANWLDPHSALAEILLARPDRRGCRLGHRQVGQRAGPHDHGVDGRLLVSLPGSSPTPPLGCATATLRAGAARDAGGAELRQPRDGPTGRRRPDRPGTRCPSMLPLGASRGSDRQGRRPWRSRTRTVQDRRWSR